MARNYEVFPLQCPKFEHFAGDGILIFFNDPIQLEKPVENAITMALEMQRNFAPLRAAWKKRAFDLDLGIGIAQGYATPGAVGFEGRWEYACIGSVANLPRVFAARPRAEKS